MNSTKMLIPAVGSELVEKLKSVLNLAGRRPIALIRLYLTILGIPSDLFGELHVQGGWLYLKLRPFSVKHLPLFHLESEIETFPLIKYIWYLRLLNEVTNVKTFFNRFMLEKNYVVFLLGRKLTAFKLAAADE